MTTAQESRRAAYRKPWYKKPWVWVIVGVLVVIGGVSALSKPESSAEGDVALVSENTVAVPDVVGKAGDEARDTLKDSGFSVKLDGGDKTVLSPKNWSVTSQTPAAGESAEKGSKVTLSVSKPDVAEAPVGSDTDALDDTTAAQYLAYQWEERFPYGGSVHWVTDCITTVNEDGTFTFKIGATFKNEYGTKIEGTVEGDVGGTRANPSIIDSILYTKTGEVINFYG